MPALLSSAVLLAVLLARPVAALSEEAPPLRVLLPPCPSLAFDASVLVEVLRVELGPGVEGGDLVVAVEPRSCESTLISLRIDDRASGRHTEEEVELADTPESDRARVLALTVAELLRAPFDPAPLEPIEEPEPLPAESAEPAQPAPDLEALVRAARAAARQEALEILGRRSQRAPPPWRAIWIGGSLGLRIMPEVRGTTTELALLLLIEPASVPALQVGLELGLGVGGGLDELGRVLSMSPSSALRLAWVARPSRAVAVSLGLRGAFGWAWAFGQGSREAIVEGEIDGATVDIEVFAALLLRMTARVRLVVDLRLGYGVVPFVPEADGRPVGGLSGPGLALGLGLVAGL